MPFTSQQKKSPRKTRYIYIYRERVCVCACVSRLFTPDNNYRNCIDFPENPPTRNCFVEFRVYGPILATKILSEKKARAETHTLPPHANTKTMSFSLQCSTSTQSSRVSTSSLTSNATSKRVVQRKALSVRAADAGTC